MEDTDKLPGHALHQAVGVIARQQGLAKLRESMVVEHALPHIGHWQGRRVRYRGLRSARSASKREMHSG